MALGIDQNTLMILALLFLGVSALYYVWLWIDGFLKDARSEDKAKQPWE